METIQKIALIFTILGAVTWGMIGFFDFSLIDYFFGTMDLLTRIIYMTIGITGLINIGILFSHIDR